MKVILNEDFFFTEPTFCDPLRGSRFIRLGITFDQRTAETPQCLASPKDQWWVFMFIHNYQ